MKKIYSKTLLVLIFIALFSWSERSFAATKILEYGFEDWSGDADTTPAYIFGTNSAAYWAQHEQVTEVVQSCSVGGNNWTPHSGNRFFYTNAYDGETDPCLGAAGHVGTYNQYGFGPATYGANSDFSYQNYINYESGDRELYTRFWIRLDPNWKVASWVNGAGDPASSASANLKVFRTYMRQDGTDGCLLMFNYQNYLAFVCTGEVVWNRGVNILNTHGVDLIDGSWHQIAVWHKLQDTAGAGFGSAKVWVDGLQTHDAADLPMFVSDDDFEYSYFLNNFSAYYPTSHISMALDDIEVWDGIPEAGGGADTVAPSAPSGLSVN